MILAAIVAGIIGIAQVFFTAAVFSAVIGGKAVKGILVLLVKLAIYAFALWLLFKLFKVFVIAAAIGYGIGFLPCLFIYVIYRIKKS